MADLKKKDNHNNHEIKIWRGCPLPIGPSITHTGINFSVFSRHATAVTLVLFPKSESDPRVEVVLDPRYNKTGDIWHIHVAGLTPGIEYGFRMDQKPIRDNKIHKFNKNIILIDPYAKALSGGDEWGKQPYEEYGSKNGRTRKSLIVQQRFAWDLDQPLNISPEDSIIYELHIRGFTRHPSSGVKPFWRQLRGPGGASRW